jgi:hypothetical protein
MLVGFSPCQDLNSVDSKVEVMAVAMSKKSVRLNQAVAFRILIPMVHVMEEALDSLME